MKTKFFWYATSILTVSLFILSCSPTPPSSDEETQTLKEITFSAESEQALDHLNLGIEEQSLGKIIRAREHFNEAIKLDPDLAVAYAFRAPLSQSAKDYSHNINMALEKNKNLTKGEDLLVKMAEASFKNDLENQLKIAEQLVKEYPESSIALTRMGDVKTQLNEDKEARDYYNKAISANSNFPAPYISLINSYLFKDPKELDEALTIANTLQRIRPNHSSSYIIIGDVYRAQNDLGEAYNSYSKAIELDPTAPGTFLKRGHASTMLNNFEEARQDYVKAQATSEVKTGAVIFEALTYVYDGNYKSAIQRLEKEVQSIDQSDAPEDIKRTRKNQCYWNISAITYHFKDIDRLKEVHAKRKPLFNLLAEDKGTEEAKINFQIEDLTWSALIDILENKIQDAWSKTEQIKVLIENNNLSHQFANAYYPLTGLIKMKQKNYAAAVADLLKANQNNVYYRYELAKAYEMNGQKEEAENIFTELENHNFNNTVYALIRNELKERKMNI